MTAKKSCDGTGLVLFCILSTSHSLRLETTDITSSFNNWEPERIERFPTTTSIPQTFKNIQKKVNPKKEMAVKHIEDEFDWDFHKQILLDHNFERIKRVKNDHAPQDSNTNEIRFTEKQRQASGINNEKFSKLKSTRKIGAVRKDSGVKNYKPALPTATRRMDDEDVEKIMSKYLQEINMNKFIHLDTKIKPDVVETQHVKVKADKTFKNAFESKLKNIMPVFPNFPSNLQDESLKKKVDHKITKSNLILKRKNKNEKKPLGSKKLFINKHKLYTSQTKKDNRKIKPKLKVDLLAKVSTLVRNFKKKKPGQRIVKTTTTTTTERPQIERSFSNTPMFSMTPFVHAKTHLKRDFLIENNEKSSDSAKIAITETPGFMKKFFPSPFKTNTPRDEESKPAKSKDFFEKEIRIYENHDFKRI